MGDLLLSDNPLILKNGYPEEESSKIKQIEIGSSHKYDRYFQLFMSTKYSDCTFIVEDTKLPAHRLILACSSPVFEEMFYGDLARDTIEIKDSTVEYFTELLRYVYLDSAVITSIEQAWNLVYLSRKYFLQELMDQCLAYIKKNLTIDNMGLCYEYSSFHQLKDLEEYCFRQMCMFTKEVLLLSSYHLKPMTLDKLFYKCLDYPRLWSYVIIGIVKWVAVELNEDKPYEASPEEIWEFLERNKMTHYLSSKSLPHDFIPFSGQSEDNYTFVFSELTKFVYKQYLDVIIRESPTKPLDGHEYLKFYKLLHGSFSFRPFCKNLSSFENNDDPITIVTETLTSDRDICLNAVLTKALNVAFKHSEPSGYDCSIKLVIRCEETLEEIHSESVALNSIYFNDNLIIPLTKIVVLRENVAYRFRFEHTIRKNVVVVDYCYEGKMIDKNTVITFSDQNIGSAVVGLCFFPL